MNRRGFLQEIIGSGPSTSATVQRPRADAVTRTADGPYDLPASVWREILQNSAMHDGQKHISLGVLRNIFKRTNGGY
jgi:hypothetical protein